MRTHALWAGPRARTHQDARMREAAAVVSDQHDISLYPNRAKALLVVSVYGGFLLLMAFPTFMPGPPPAITTHPWSYQEPFHTGIFIFCAVCIVPLVLVYLGWMVTPWPYLRLNQTELVYQRFPFVRRRIPWADVTSIGAWTTSMETKGMTFVTLHLAVRIRPEALATYGNRTWVRLRLVQRLLPVPVAEIAPLLAHYCQVLT